MHLIRLLSVSDTFTAGEIPVGRYHVVGLKVLPRFRSAGLAVRAPVRPTRRWHGAEKSSATVAEVVGRTKLEVEPVGLPAASGIAAVAPREREAVVKPSLPERGPEEEVDRPGWWRRGKAWLMERFGGSRNPFGGSGLRVARTVRPRQGMLRLDAVQVVCNDLKDSDFEVVPVARPRGAASGTKGWLPGSGGGRLVEPGQARAGGGGL